MKITIIPNRPASGAKEIELLFEIAKAFVDMDIGEGDDVNESDLPNLSE